MVGRALQILLGLFVVVRLLLSKPACYYWGESHSRGKTNWWGCLVCCVGKSKRPNFFASLICMDSNLTSSRNLSTRLLLQESLSKCYRIWRGLPKEQRYKIKAQKDNKSKNTPTAGGMKVSTCNYTWVVVVRVPAFNHNYKNNCLHTTTHVVEKWIWPQWSCPLLMQSLEWR